MKDRPVVEGYIPRALEPIVRDASSHFPVLLVTGPRQVGKTTMLRHLMADSPRGYLSLDDLELRQQARSNPRLFLEVNKPPLLIDEVQYAPELFTYLKLRADSGAAAGDYWLTGSQAFKLMRGVQESLAGRVALLSLSSLSQAELAGAESTPFVVNEDALLSRSAARPIIGPQQLNESIVRGSMPKLACDKTLSTELYYSSYLGSYIQRDVKELSSAIDEFKFLDFIRSAAVRCAQPVNYAGLARDSGIDQKTAKSWLGMLEALGLVFLLHPYSNNLLERTVKSPKLYFSDTGLAAYLARMRSGDELRQSAFHGAMLENYVVAEVAKSYTNAGIEAPLYYYRDAAQREIDLIIWGQGTVSPVEIKSSANPQAKDIKAFRVLEALSPKPGFGAVICLAPGFGTLTEGSYTVPVSLV